MNHLEQLVAEWLQYRDYFVRVSVPVGKRALGGFEGELDVVAINLTDKHLLHVECSLDALSAAKREERFKAKFERGKRFIWTEVFRGLAIPEDVELEQVLILQFASGRERKIGGARLVTVREFIREINAGLADTSPQSKAVPSNLPLLRTLQLALDARRTTVGEHRLLRKIRE